MSVSAAIPTVLPTPPAPGRGQPQAEPARPDTPFAGLLGEKRLALARGPGREATPHSATDATDAGSAKTETDAAADPGRSAEAEAAPSSSDEIGDGSRREPSPVLDWFASWQPDPAAPRALGAALPSTAAAAPAGESALPAEALPSGAASAVDPVEAGSRKGRPAVPTAMRGLASPDDATADADAAPTREIPSIRQDAEHLLAQDASSARVEFTAPEARSAEPAPAPQAAAVATPGLAGPTTTGVPTVTLATPLASPDFSQALAAQLTTLARDGVHEARLQLNPAEMGPIAVQIVVDGSQAQVDFAAAQAGTRQALEASLPSLAAALQGLGLTLSGGGVFEHGQAARDGRADGEPSRGPRRLGGQAGDDATATRRPVALPARAGLLDLYA